MTSEMVVFLIMVGLFGAIGVLGCAFWWLQEMFYKARERRYRKLYPDYFKAWEDYRQANEEYGDICREIHRLKGAIEVDTADLIYYTEDKIKGAEKELEKLKTELAVARGAKFRKDEERTILRKYAEQLRNKYNIKNF
jgi:hypothetical protein